MRRAGIDYAELEEQRQGLGGAGEPARLRRHRPMMLNSYHKPVA
jgi:hypothetical protein